MKTEVKDTTKTETEVKDTTKTEIKVKEFVEYLKIESEEYDVEWVIEGFNKIPLLEFYPLRSSTFALGERGESIWQLLVCKSIRNEKEPEPDDTVDSDDDDASFELKSFAHSPENMDTSGKEEVKLVRKIGVKLQMVPEWYRDCWETVEYYFVITAGATTFKSDCETQVGTKNESDIEEEHRFAWVTEIDFGADIFSATTITLDVHIKFKVIDNHPVQKVTEDNIVRMSEDILYMYKTKAYADIILKARDKEIPAHRNILCARAYGFDLKLKEDSEETTKSKIELDVDVRLVQSMLCYIYSGGFYESLTVKDLPALFKVSKQFEADGLKFAAFDMLVANGYMCKHCRNTERSNVLDRILTAEDEEGLKKKIRTFCSHAKIM